MGRALKLGMRTLLPMLLLSSLALAKPMMAPTLAEAVRSPLIVIATYSDFEAKEPIEYFSAPLAHFHIERVLKGAAPESALVVRYAFTDGSACLAPPDWKFSASMMPAKGSRWILFLQHEDDGAWSTYRGDWGRWPADEAHLREVTAALPKR